MNSPKTTLHPQTEAIPQPLEIHPSIPSDLGKKLLGIVELFLRDPSRYDGGKAYLEPMFVYFGVKGNRDGCGCICAHLAGPDRGGRYVFERWPSKAPALASIYDEAASNDTTEWAIARIETFLRTGK